MGIAYGHNLYAPTPPDFFEFKWAWDPTLLFFLALCILYIHGLRSFKGRKPVALWQQICFFLGISINVAALSPPIDPLSDQLFFVHMIQHIMITSVGVPLMIFGVPFFIALRGMHPTFRRRCYIPFIRNRLVRLINRLWRVPLIAVVVFIGNYWFWHIPRFYNLALLNDVIHLVEHGCLALSAVYFWRVIIDPKPLVSPLPLPARVLYLAVMMALNVVLSATLTFTERVLYAYEGLPLPTWWRWDHLMDQKLGGLIMWVPGGALTFLAMTGLFMTWVYRERRKEFSEVAHQQTASAPPTVLAMAKPT